MSKYEPNPKTLEQINAAFGGRSGGAATDDQQDRAKRINAFAWKLSELVIQETPPGRAQSVALTSIEDAVLWSLSAIAHEPHEP
jgi:hypothetical protein